MAEERKKRKSPERTGPIVRREMTQIRDEVGEIRRLVRIGNSETVKMAAERLDALYSRLDKLDLRFKLHHDKAAKKTTAKRGRPKGSGKKK